MRPSSREGTKQRNTREIWILVLYPHFHFFLLEWESYVLLIVVARQNSSHKHTFDSKMIKICDATPGTLHIRQVGGFQKVSSFCDGGSSSNGDSSLLVDDYEVCSSSSSSSTISIDGTRKKRHRRGISFSDIEVYEFPLVLGDNPCVSCQQQKCCSMSIVFVFRLFLLLLCVDHTVRWMDTLVEEEVKLHKF